VSVQELSADTTPRSDLGLEWALARISERAGDLDREPCWLCRPQVPVTEERQFFSLAGHCQDHAWAHRRRGEFAAL
jgi:hypothetical protein